jgi:hypothetical protein
MKILKWVFLLVEIGDFVLLKSGGMGLFLKQEM